jgi:aminopeptidase
MNKNVNIDLGKLLCGAYESEKVRGTVHVAVGNNVSYGGDNGVPLHLDGVITKPDIYLDSVKLTEKGFFLR